MSLTSLTMRSRAVLVPKVFGKSPDVWWHEGMQPAVPWQISRTWRIWGCPHVHRTSTQLGAQNHPSGEFLVLFPLFFLSSSWHSLMHHKDASVDARIFHVGCVCSTPSVVVQECSNSLRGVARYTDDGANSREEAKRRRVIGMFRSPGMQ